jgi:hypothetical protein
VSVSWTSGDGGRTICNGPGTQYASWLPAAWQTTDCSHVYVHTSAGQPSLDGNPDDGTFVVTATVEWAVSWTSTGVVGGGALPTLYTGNAELLRVTQVESVNTDGVPSSSWRSAAIGLGA